MPRYRLIIEYDGTGFVGWQRQTGLASVQAVIEDAIRNYCGTEITVQAAGRTDKGVHARGQVVHFDLDDVRQPFRIREALNFHLKPFPVVVLSAERVEDTFEARFSATARHYQYLILNRRPQPVIEADRVWHVPVSLDADAMHLAAQVLVGRHDFTTFRATDCQARSPMKTLDKLSVRREGEHVIASASSRSFLHHQVRSMVGSLKKVGEGKWPHERIAEVLAAKDRQLCGPMAPACGLYLMQVDY